MKKISILLVENHALVMESIHQSLEREANFTVVGEATDGEEAVQMARELRVEICHCYGHISTRNQWH